MKNLTWQNPEQLFVAQELINKVKSKCCGIKVIMILLSFSYFCSEHLMLLSSISHAYLHSFHIVAPAQRLCISCRCPLYVRYLSGTCPLLYRTYTGHLPYKYRTWIGDTALLYACSIGALLLIFWRSLLEMLEICTRYVGVLPFFLIETSCTYALASTIQRYD